jgi:hypothetical protein
MFTTVVRLPHIALDPTQRALWETIKAWSEENEANSNLRHASAYLQATYITSFPLLEQAQPWLTSKRKIAGRRLKNALIEQLQKGRGNEMPLQLVRQINSPDFVVHGLIVSANYPEDQDKFYVAEGTMNDKRAASKRWEQAWLVIEEGIKELVENSEEAINEFFLVPEIIPESALNYARTHSVENTINMLTNEYDKLAQGKRYTHVANATANMMRGLAADGVNSISSEHIHRFTSAMDGIAGTANECKAAKDLLLSFCKTSSDPRITAVAMELHNDAFTMLMAADRIRAHETDRAQADDVLKAYQPPKRGKAESKETSEEVKLLMEQVKILRDLQDKRTKLEKTIPPPKTGLKVSDRLGGSPSSSGCLHAVFTCEDGTVRCTLCCKVTTLTGQHTANNCFSGPAEKHRHFNTPEAIVAHAVVVSKERKTALGKGPWSEGPTAVSKNNNEQRAMAVRSSKVPKLLDGSSEDEEQQQPKENDDDGSELLREAYLAGQRDAATSGQQQQQAGMHFGSYGYTGGTPYNGMQWGDIV